MGYWVPNENGNHSAFAMASALMQMMTLAWALYVKQSGGKFEDIKPHITETLEEMAFKYDRNSQEWEFNHDGWDFWIDAVKKFFVETEFCDGTKKILDSDDLFKWLCSVKELFADEEAQQEFFKRLSEEEDI